MNTKEAIEFIEAYIRLANIWSISIRTNEKLKLKEVITLLKRGEAYEKILGEVEYELNWHKPEEPLFTAKLEVSKDEEYLNEICDLISNIKQKYFPKEERMKELTESIKKNKDILRQLTDLHKGMKDLKSRVKTLEQNNSYYPTKEEIENIKVGGTD